MEKNLLLKYLHGRRKALSELEDGIQMHSALCEMSPDFYLHLLADPIADVSHKRQILALLLTNSEAARIGRPQMLERLYALPVKEALQVVMVVHDQRINRSRARELVLSFLIGHEQFPSLAAISKQRVSRLLKHALGERTWSTVKRWLTEETAPEREQFLQRELFRYAWNGDVARAREALNFLAGGTGEVSDPTLAKSLAARKDLEQGKGLPVETLLGLRGIYHKDVSLQIVRSLAELKQQITRRVDGSLTAFYKEAFQIAALSPDEEMAGNYDLAQKVETASAPIIEGRLAIVLDMSASMASSGERLYHPASLALSLTRLLRKRVSTVHLIQAGGSSLAGNGMLPALRGATDLALALITAVQENPEAILVITDGYENMRQGDAEQVVQGLRLLEIHTPIYQVVPVFKAGEKLEQRLLGESIPVIPVNHEDDVRELLLHLVLAPAGETVSARALEQVQELLIAR